MSTNLTASQQAVIDLLLKGWQLAVDDSRVQKRIWVETNTGCGGKQLQEVRQSIFESLLEAGCIVQIAVHFPVVIYTAAVERSATE